MRTDDVDFTAASALELPTATQQLFPDTPYLLRREPDLKRLYLKHQLKVGDLHHFILRLTVC